MKIGIDARLYSQTGVGVYIRNFLYYLPKIYSGKDEFYIADLTQSDKKWLGIPYYGVMD